MTFDRKRIGVFVFISSVLIAAYLRFANLGVPALWIDEVLLVRFTKNLTLQEIVPQIAVWLFTSLFGGPEFMIRLPFALAGILTVAFIPLVIRRNTAFPAMAFVAVFPLFVFWSRVARPYALAGLFIVLAWRWKWFMLPAILCTPIALVGAHFVKIRSIWFWTLMAGFSALSFVIRSDAGERNFFDVSFVLNVRRIWYVPALVAVLWCADYLFDRGEHRHPGGSRRGEGGLVEQ